MKTPTVVTGAPARTRLSALGKLTVAAVIGLPLLLSTDFFQHGVNVANLVFTGIGLLLAAIVTGIMVATRWRWSPLLGAVVYVLVLAGSIYILPYALSHPNESYLFDFNVVGLALTAGMIVVSLIVAANPQASAASANPNGEPVVYLASDHFAQNVVLVHKGSKLLIVDDGSIEHVLQNGMWDTNGTPHSAAEPGAPAIR